jgi:hypothetical protein
MKTLQITSAVILSAAIAIATPVLLGQEKGGGHEGGQGQQQSRPAEQRSAPQQQRSAPQQQHAAPQQQQHAAPQQQRTPQAQQQRSAPQQQHAQQPQQRTQNQPAQNHAVPSARQRVPAQNRTTQNTHQSQGAQQALKQQQGRNPQKQQQARQSGFQQSRATNWQSQHRSWAQRGGYQGYRIPDDRFRGSFGMDHGFRLHGLPFFLYGGHPRFQYGGFWFSILDPYPEGWDNDWYDNDDVFIVYEDNGYYLYNRRYPGVGLAVSIHM